MLQILYYPRTEKWLVVEPTDLSALGHRLECTVVFEAPTREDAEAAIEAAAREAALARSAGQQ